MSKPRILIVDDEEIVRMSHLRSLAGADCDLKAVTNGDEALCAMEQFPFDVVLLDLRMPGSDGMSVLKAIKRQWPASEVVIITGYPALDTAKEAIRLGAYDYLSKPVGPDEVINAANGAMLQKKWTMRGAQKHEVAA